MNRLLTQDLTLLFFGRQYVLCHASIRLKSAVTFIIKINKFCDMGYRLCSVVALLLTPHSHRCVNSIA